MKKIIGLLAFVLLFSTCKKAALKGDYFVFGTYYGECIKNCARYYLLKKGELYEDNVDSSSDKLEFKNKQLSAEKYNLAKALRERLPEFLKNSGETRFGCPDCRDQGGYYIEFQEGDKKKKFHIDTDLSQIPEEIRPYILELQTVLGQL